MAHRFNQEEDDVRLWAIRRSQHGLLTQEQDYEYDRCQNHMATKMIAHGNLLDNIAHIDWLCKQLRTVSVLSMPNTET